MSITDDKSLMRLLTKINDEKGLDFTQYKKGTLLRRINSRLNRYKIDSYDDYIKVLEKEKGEYDELINSLSINVTDFFRNPESFDAISKIVIPRVIYAKRDRGHKIIRAWSCGCSTGDEPYSLAMLLLEKLGKARSKFILTIVGSDIDKDALTQAKEMKYSADRLKALDSELLAKYFEEIDSENFKIKSLVRSMVRFRHHNIIKDRPFVHCDIILCRNLLIYFNKQLQEETILKFYECLNPGGYLILGMTESLIGAAVDCFDNVNNRLRIFRKPESKTEKDEAGGILSQDDIDKIVGGLLEG